MKFKALAAITSILLLAGCAAPSPEPTDDGKLHIVTSTNVWADLVQTIGGEYVSVTAIVTNPNQDPHSYEITPKDKLIISKADAVVLACNSTDSWFVQTDTSQNIWCLGGNSVFDEKLNPHVWYNLRDIATNVIPTIASNLAIQDPTHAQQFQANQHTFEQQAATMLDWAHQYLEQNQLHIDKKFIATEMVANDLLIELGFQDVTPADVIQAGRNETDLSPKQIADLKNLLYGKLFVYNKSQQSAQTDDLLKFLADTTCNDHISVNEDGTQTQASPSCLVRARPVGFYEQLPAGITYLEWMNLNLQEIVGVATETVFN